AVPYSMVAAVDASGGIRAVVPRDMADDEIVIGNWLADDLGAGPRDEITLSYYVMGEMRRIVEESRSFRIRDIVATEQGGDGYMMPDFPGLADAENCRDWEPGVDIDLDRIRDKDEEYWDRYRGLPKAFVTLRAGQEMWANRFGGLTAVRYSAVAHSAQGIESAILGSVDPAQAGLSLGPVRQLGQKAGSEATDFGGLFLGLSMFLIAAAVILVALIFVFGVEKRSGQIGMLLAVGFSPKLVKRLLLGEGAVLALGGAIAGGFAGILYTRAMIYGLETVWQDAVAGSAIQFHAKGSTIFYGGLSAVVISLFGIWLSLRKQLRREVRQLLSGRIEESFVAGAKGARGGKSLYVGAVSLVGALVLVGLSLTGKIAGSAGAFFGAGALLLVGCLALTKTGLRAVAGAFGRRVKGIGGLGIRNSTRRASRSLAVVGMLSVGVFMVIAVGANRKNPLAGADRRDSGTGGFALYGESTIGVLEDLNTAKGRKAIGIDARAVLAADIVQLRVRDGDDASCLNLNRAQKPRLLGVQVSRLKERGAFGFVSVLEGAKEDGWSLLEAGAGGDTVYAVGDYATVRWALGRNVGDEIEYTDEKGRGFRLKIVGMIKDSILQGNLIISAAEFERRFPSEDGYRGFLIDVADEKNDEVSSALSTGLADYGREVSPTVERLARFNAVENTYLSIFQLLGGLGLILGSIGLGLVVMLNVLQRRGELAMMRAVGFGRKMLKKMVLFEHAGLMLTGLACGTVAALVAVAPALKAPGAEVPYVSLAVTIAAIGASGIIWIWAATAF
ncbi:MAG: FtsX-like permease family protein, partial [Planctomycetes bacterium]|nr:FtsX-like permease family protein [Planctomycetota bacterium]